MTISTMDGLVAGLTSGHRIPFYKLSLSAATGGAWMSLWTATGLPGAGATPASGAGAVPTAATAGALNHINPGGGSLAYLAGLDAFCVNSGVVIIFDRLVHTAGLDGTVTSAQTVNSTAITRPDANGGDVECWLEVYTQIGATSRTATVSYTNQAGTSGRSGTATIGGSSVARDVGRLLPVVLQAGDTGVRSVQSVTLSGSTGTAGSFGVTLLRRVAELGVPSANVAALSGAMDVGLPRIYDDACLALAVFCTQTSTGNLGGMAMVASG